MPESLLLSFEIWKRTARNFSENSTTLNLGAFLPVMVLEFLLLAFTWSEYSFSQVFTSFCNSVSSWVVENNLNVYFSVFTGVSDLLWLVSTSIPNLPNMSGVNLNLCLTKLMLPSELSIASILFMSASLKSSFFTLCNTAMN